MAFELVYTSAQQGLQPGATGFCTVAMTNGIPPMLMKKLESFTGYRPFYEHYDPRSAQNPPAFLHYQWLDGRNKYDILGRICSCEADHTGRSNKLAHFLVVNEIEKKNSPCGPADYSGAVSPFLVQWQGAPKLYPTERCLQPLRYVPKVASLWKEYKGDAGWAGYLADCFMNAPDKPVYILFNPEIHHDILGLVSEALNVLPENARWRVSYNTCFMNIPSDIQCNWRFCIDTPEFFHGVLPNTTVIRLSDRSSVPSESRLVSMARSTIREIVPRTSPVVEVPDVENTAPVKSLGDMLKKNVSSGGESPLRERLQREEMGAAVIPRLRNNNISMCPSQQFPSQQQIFVQKNGDCPQVALVAISVLCVLSLVFSATLWREKTSLSEEKKNLSEELRQSKEKVESLSEEKKNLSEELRQSKEKVESLLVQIEEKAEQEHPEEGRNKEEGRTQDVLSTSPDDTTSIEKETIPKDEGVEEIFIQQAGNEEDPLDREEVPDAVQEDTSANPSTNSSKNKDRSGKRKGGVSGGGQNFQRKNVSAVVKDEDQAN